MIYEIRMSIKAKKGIHRRGSVYFFEKIFVNDFLFLLINEWS